MFTDLNSTLNNACIDTLSLDGKLFTSSLSQEYLNSIGYNTEALGEHWEDG
ncbi:hypothetical protein [Vibrio sp.]|uniref:hypothetical protein n=1 Tax=Vibrio sp. TaxID=678 RepID=UPI003F6D5498